MEMKKILFILPLLVLSSLRVGTSFEQKDTTNLRMNCSLLKNDIRYINKGNGDAILETNDGNSAYAFDKDNLINSSLELQKARTAFKCNFPVYLYGQKVTTDDFAKLVAQSDSYYVFEKPSQNGIASKISLSLPINEFANVISGSLNYRNDFKPSISFSSNNSKDLNYEKMIENDLLKQKEENQSRSVETIKYSPSLMYSYLSGNANYYIEASWQLLQDTGELDPDAYGYGVTSQISTSVRGTNLVRVNSYFKVTNTSNMVVNDLAPKNKTNTTLNVSMSGGTSGFNVSLGTTISSDPFYNYVPDRTHGSVMFQWDEQATALNDDFFGSGISWNTSSYRPSIIFKFWGDFYGFADTTPSSVLITGIAK